MLLFKKWLISENGFVTFESSVLAIGGIIVALIVGVWVLTITGGEYTRVENEVIGNGVETSASLQRFR